MNFLQEMVGVVNPKAASQAEQIAIRKRQHSNVTATLKPFESHSNYIDDLTPDRSIMELILDMDLIEDQFRSSSRLKEVLNEIVSSISLFHCWGKQSIKVRLNAFVKLLVEQLCVPHINALYSVGAKLFSSSTKVEPDFIGHVKLILIEAFTLFKLAEECILDIGDDSCLDKRRFRLFIMLMELKCSPLFSYSMTIREYGETALISLSCHILSVTVITTCIINSIKIVINRLSTILNTETTSTSTSSNFIENHTILETIVIDYFIWLRSNYNELIKMCRKEEILHSVDNNIRAWLRSETYNSPYEIISIYNQKYREKLTHMSIPLQPFRLKDLEQAKKDVIRETVLLNNILYSAGTATNATSSITINNNNNNNNTYTHSGSTTSTSTTSTTINGKKLEHTSTSTNTMHICSMIRCELRKVLAYLFEIDVFLEEEEEDSDNITDTGEVIYKLDSNHSGSSSVKLLVGNWTPKSTVRKVMDSPDAKKSQSCELADTNNSDNNSGHNANNKNSTSSSSNNNNNNNNNNNGNDTNNTTSSPPTTTATPIPSIPRTSTTLTPTHSHWQHELLDTLYAYTILGASRTFAGGDAFLILNDLYGGEGLTFCPSRAPRYRGGSSSNSKGVLPGSPSYTKQSQQSQQQQHNNSTISNSNKKNLTTINTPHNNYTTDDIHINISIISTGVRIVMSERYNLFIATEMNTCSDLSTLKPLMRFECTTTTLIHLQSYKQTQYKDKENNLNNNTKIECQELFQRIISNPEYICRRAVTIEPYL